jgi:hypothetical protein
MANDLDNPGVLVLDTAAVISTTNLFVIRKLRLVPAAAAALAQVRDGSDRIIAALAAAANGHADEINFSPPHVMTGFELESISGAGAVLYVYGN